MKYALFIFFYIFSNIVFSQITFYQDIFKGGVSGYGYTGFNPHYLKIKTPSNSTIKKAFLFCGNSFSDTIEHSIYLNYQELTFKPQTQVSLNYNSESLNDIANVHSLDVTNIIRGITDSVIFSSPITNNNSQYYFQDFYLLVIYKNSLYPKIAISVDLINQDVTGLFTNQHTLSSPLTNKPISISLLTGHMVTHLPDSTDIILNNTFEIGRIGGGELYGNSNAGIFGNFYYQNDTLYGMNDDTPDSIMNGPDALADLKSYVNSTNIEMKYSYQPSNHPLSGPTSNPIWATFLTYSTKCDTLKSYLTTSDTTICAGEPLVLQVGGLEQYSYAWRYRGEVVGTDTALSITPEHNRLYSILVSDTNGCSKTEIINVKVNPKPSFATTVSNAICPNNNGSIVLDSVQGVAPPFRYKKDNGNWQTAPVYGYLPQGNYNISLRDTNSCIATQNVTVESINNSIANFSFANALPFVPTEVVFENQSQNTSEYQWLVNGTNADNTENLAYLFELAGSYEITLIASQPNGLCVDTITKTITLNNEDYFYVPTTINGEIVVFSHGYQSVNFSLVNALGQQIFSKNTAITSSEQLILNHKKIAKGIYFYQAEAVKDDGEIVLFSGKVLF